MSKLDTVQNMNKKQVSEAELIQAKLSLLQQQDDLKMKSMQELITLLQSSQKSINKSVMELERAQNVIRDYPSDLERSIYKMLNQFEQSAQACKEAAQQASQTYATANRIYNNSEWKILLGCIAFIALGGLAFGVLIYRQYFG